jgi:hypothetical protein
MNGAIDAVSACCAASAQPLWEAKGESRIFAANGIAYSIRFQFSPSYA